MPEIMIAVTTPIMATKTRKSWRRLLLTRFSFSKRRIWSRFIITLRDYSAIPRASERHAGQSPTRHNRAHRIVFSPHSIFQATTAASRSRKIPPRGALPQSPGPDTL
jgi:hypothetical protein